MTTQAVLTYTATTTSPNTVANLTTAMGNVELNYDLLPTLGAKLVSDVTTSPTTSTAVRTVTISFIPEVNTFPVTDHSAQPASIDGTVDITTLAYGGGGDLNGLSLNFAFGGQGNPESDVNFTFGAPANPGAALAEINAVIAPYGVATEAPDTHLIVLSTTALGAQANLTLLASSTALTILGLDATTASGIAANPFKGSVVSSSPSDSSTGSGAQRVQIDYVDAKGQPGLEYANMNGTTPVQLLASKVTVTNITSLSGTPAGLIAVYTDNPQVTSTTSDGVPVVNPYASGDCAGQLLGSFRGTIVSTSKADGPGGSGATSVVVHYEDTLGNPHTETATMAGTKPVVLGFANNATVTDIVPNVPNAGIITVYSGDTKTSTGAPAGQLPASFNSSYPASTDQAAPFRDLYTHTIANGLGSVVVASAPVVS